MGGGLINETTTKTLQDMQERAVVGPERSQG